jgi:hypothetical protein
MSGGAGVEREQLLGVSSMIENLFVFFVPFCG